MKLVKRIGDVGEIRDKTKFRNEDDNIYAFKPKPDRFLCFFTRDKTIVITNGFRKKQNKLPKNVKELAIKHMKDYIQRVSLGDYYE